MFKSLHTYERLGARKNRDYEPPRNLGMAGTAEMQVFTGTRSFGVFCWRAERVHAVIPRNLGLRGIEDAQLMHAASISGVGQEETLSVLPSRISRGIQCGSCGGPTSSQDFLQNDVLRQCRLLPTGCAQPDRVLVVRGCDPLRSLAWLTSSNVISASKTRIGSMARFPLFVRGLSGSSIQPRIACPLLSIAGCLRKCVSIAVLCSLFLTTRART